MTVYTHKPPCGSTNYSFSTTDSLVLAGSVNSHILIGNIIPREWYQKFTNDRGAPDLSLMAVLSEIVYWYRPKRLKNPNTMVVTYVNKFLGDAWQTSYEHFENKFGFNREKIRRIFVKLERMGICAREFRTVKLRGQIYNNRLFIHLSSAFLNSHVSNKRNVSADVNWKASFSASKEEGGSPHFEGDHIIDTKNKNINKDRSMKSNFLQNSFFKKEQGGLGVKHRHSSAALQLKDFYPLSPEDAKSLQIHSGREFSLNAMNEILLDMSKRVKDRRFKSRKGFLGYMSIVFKHEMRDACKVSNEGFKIKANQTVEEITSRRQEEFLSQIEYSLQVSPEWHLKKKLCSVLEREKAYNLLSSYKNCRLNGDTFEIHLTKQLELTSLDQDIILNQVKATHESFNLSTGNFMSISSLKLVAPALLPKAVEQGDIFPSGTWGSIRQALISYFGKEGDALDRAWFSKLTSEVDETAKRITLKAPSEFFRDWINRKYLSVIEKIIDENHYKMSFC